MVAWTAYPDAAYTLASPSPTPREAPTMKTHFFAARLADTMASATGGAISLSKTVLSAGFTLCKERPALFLGVLSAFRFVSFTFRRATFASFSAVATAAAPFAATGFCAAMPA